MNPDELIARTPTTPEQLIVPTQVVGPEEPDISWLRKRFDDARDLTQEARKRCELDRDYFDGKQLTPATLKALRLRRQPEVWANRIRPAVNGIVGVIEAGRTDPRAWPRNPGDANAADTASKVLRFIADKARFDSIKLDVARNFLVEGTGAAIVEFDGEQVAVNQIRWEEFFADPFSRRPDFDDATYKGIAKWMNARDVQGLYPERYKALGDPVDGPFGVEDTWEDRPKDGGRWIDKRAQRLMVVEMYYRSGDQWIRCVFCAAGTLDLSYSPYKDEKGRSICPIVAMSYEVDRDNNRYGHVRDMIPLQNEVNARRSRTLHDANTRQVQNTDLNASPVDTEIVRREAARPDGVLPMGYQVVGKSEMTQANVLLLQDAKGELERMGPTPAVLGRQDGAAQSGRARLVLQQAGMTELTPALARLEAWELACYQQMWWRAKQFFTDPMWIRITDDPRTPQFLQINQPVMGEVPVPTLDPVSGEEVIQYAEAPVGMNNGLAEMEIDIIIDSVPDTANLAQEVWEGLLELAKIVPIGTPQFMIALEMSPLPNKQEVVERIKALMQGDQQEPDPMQEAQAELGMQAAQAKVRLDVAKAEKTEVEAGAIAFELGNQGLVDEQQAA